MRRRIGHKLILVVAAASVAIIVAFSYLIVSSQQRVLISQLEHNAHQLSETIKSGTQHDMLLNLPEGLHHTIDTVGKQEAIEKIRIFNKEGMIIYSSDASIVGTMVDKREEACYGCHAAGQPLERLPMAERSRIFTAPDEFRRLGVINPIYNEPSCWQGACHAHDAAKKVLGVLDVTVSLEAVDREMETSRNRVLLFMSTAVLAIGLIIWFFVDNLVSRPVSRLVEATEAVAQGDLTSKIEVTRKDELGHLADSFNRMTQRLAEAQQQLYQSEKLASLGRLAAGVAHEINNPLTGVLTFSSFLLKRTKDNPEQKEDLETIVRETKRCRQIVKGLLDFSRQVPVTKTNVSIADVIVKSLTIVRNRLSVDNVTVDQDVATDLPPIKADPNQMAQVVINLLVNAADAIGANGGKISISAQVIGVAPTRRIEVLVADTGCGIPAEALPKIFEPFYSTKGRDGTGLGLAMVWGIVDQHGGTIQLKSQVGVGTTVTLHLPVDPAAAKPVTA